MTTNVTVFDKRLAFGGMPTVPTAQPNSHVIFTDKMTPLDRMVSEIVDVGRPRIGVLRLMCNAAMLGPYAPDPLNGKMSYWLGLQLADGLTAEPMSYGRFAPLRGMIRSIVVYTGLSLSYADDASRRGAPVADGGAGRLLIQALADQTLAAVIAPDALQSAKVLGSAWDVVRGRPWVLDFGTWEGQLWRYTPNQKRPVRHDL